MYIFIFKKALNDVEFQLTHHLKSDLVDGTLHICSVFVSLN